MPAQRPLEPFSARRPLLGSSPSMTVRGRIDRAIRDGTLTCEMPWSIHAPETNSPCDNVEWPR